MDPDRIEAALAGLGPESRALVELSVIREVADDDIASLLGTEEAAVRSRREDALAQLAAALGRRIRRRRSASLVRDMRELPAVRWRDDGQPDAGAQTVRPQSPHRAPEPPTPVVQPGAKRKRRAAPAAARRRCWSRPWRWCSRSPEAATTTRSPAPAEEPASARPPAGKPAKLEPRRRRHAARATAEIENGTLDLSVTGLPDPAAPATWSGSTTRSADARPLNQPQPEPEFELKAKLPEGAESYRYLDVSLEPADDNRNHSGQSVLRLPLSSLR